MNPPTGPRFGSHRPRSARLSRIGGALKLDAEVELPGAAAFLPQLARRLVKRGVDDNLAALKQILEDSR